MKRKVLSLAVLALMMGSTSCEKIEVEPIQTPISTPTSFTIEEGAYKQIAVKYPNINDTLYGTIGGNDVSDSIKITQLLINTTVSSGNSSDVFIKLRFGHVNPDTLSNPNFNGVVTLGFDGEVNFQLVNDWQSQVEWGDNGFYNFREIDLMEKFDGWVFLDDKRIDFTTGTYVEYTTSSVYMDNERYFILENSEGVQFILRKEN